MPRVAILAALRRATQTGEGAHIDMALLDTQVRVLANQAMNYLVIGRAAQAPGQRAIPTSCPTRRSPSPTASSSSRSATTGSSRGCAPCLADPSWPDDPDFRTNADRIANREPLCGTISELTSGWTRDDLLAALEKAGVPAGPINSVAEVFADPQVIHRGMQVTLESGGTAIPSVAGPIVIDGERMVAGKASPRLGEDG